MLAVPTQFPAASNVPIVIDASEVPQADRLEEVIALVERLKNGEALRHTGSERQAGYNLNAALILGLVGKDLFLTPAGRALLALPEDVRLERLSIAFEQSSCGRAWMHYLGASSLVEIVPQSAESFVRACCRISPEVAKRRSGTLRRWAQRLMPRHPLAREPESEGRPRTRPIGRRTIFAPRETATILRELALGTRLLRAATAYFSVGGYQLLARHLRRAIVRLLVGSPEAREELEAILRDFRRSIDEGLPTSEKRHAIRQLHLELVRGTARVRHLRPKHLERLHAKLFIFDDIAAYVGSSNLTIGGLQRNREAGYITPHRSDIRDFIERFDSAFEEGEDILLDVLAPLERSWALDDGVPPGLLYLRVLVELYGHIPDPSTKAYDLARYQKMVVGSVLAALREHRGALLIAPTGTGKTIMGAYIAASLFPEAIQRVVVIAPSPRVADEWQRVLMRFGLSIDVLTHGLLQGKGCGDETRSARIDERVENLRSSDLVIVDESHNFRNSRSRGHEMLARALRAANRGEGPFCLLLTATPISTHIDDLNAQLQLITPTSRLEAPQDVSRSPAVVNITLPFILQHFGEDCVDSNSRALRFGDEKRYFPHIRIQTRHYAHALQPILEQLQGLDLRVLRSPEPRRLAQLNLIAFEEPATLQSAEFIRTSLFCAASSSPLALGAMVDNLTENLEHWKRPSADPSRLRRQLDEVVCSLDALDGDSKLDELCSDLLAISLDTRVLIFSSSKVTVKYLRAALRKRFPQRRTECVTGDLTDKDKQRLIQRFAPVANGRGRRKRKDDIDVLVCSDSLSEGANLQDATYLVNYDLHWTPLRLIQRVGRVDRPTDDARTVQVTNFYPGDAFFEANLGMFSRLQDRAEVYKDCFASTVIGDHARDLSEIGSADPGAVRALYRETDWTRLLEEYMPTTHHLVELANASAAEVEKARQLPLGVRASKKGTTAGLFALLKTARGTAYLFRFDAQDRCLEAPGNAAPEAMLKLIAADRSERAASMPSDLDTRLSALMRRWADERGENPDSMCLVCGEVVVP